MRIYCTSFSWVIAALMCIASQPAHAQTECPENYVQCINNNGSLECYNSSQLSNVTDWPPRNCSQIASNYITDECTELTVICSNVSSQVNVSLQHLCVGTIDYQQQQLLCNGTTIDCSNGSPGRNGTLCSVICNNTSWAQVENASSSLPRQYNGSVECPGENGTLYSEMTYPSPVITVNVVKRDQTQLSVVFSPSSISNTISVSAGSYVTLTCSVANTTAETNYTIVWSSPFQPTLCGPVISEDGRSWSQVATSVLSGTHTCGYLFENEMAPVNTSVSVIVEGSGLLFRSSDYGATPILNNSIIYIDNTSSSPLEVVWCASDLFLDTFNTNYTHSVIGVENMELLNVNTSDRLFEFSSCGPSLQLKYTQGGHLPQNSQGVYTCQVMVTGGYTSELSFGLYNIGSQSTLSVINLSIDTEADELTLVCSTSGSPPTEVYWSFGGTLLLSTNDTQSVLLLTAGSAAVHYMTIQRVVERTSAQYDNKLILSSNLDPAEFNISLLLGTYTCTVSNSIAMFDPSNTRSLNIAGLQFVNEEHVIGRRSRVICITDLPGIVVKWFAEGSSRAIVTSLGSTAELVFDPVNGSLNGTSYSCTILTYYGIQEEQITIRVTGPVCSPACQNGGTCEILGIQTLPSCNCVNGYSGSSCQCPPGHVEMETQCTRIATSLAVMTATPMVSSTILSDSSAVTTPSPTSIAATTTGGGVPGGQSSSNDIMLAIIIGAAGGGGLLLLVTVIVTCFILVLCKTRSRNGKGTAASQMYTIDRNPQNSNDIYDSIDDIHDGTWGARVSNVPPPIIERSDNWEVDFSRLKLNQKLGNGAFGAVYKAAMTGVSENTLPQVVAVKLLKENSTESERDILVGEINLMKTLDPHPHVIQMVGYSITDEMVALVLEFCHRGNLKEFLRKNNSKFQLFPNSRRASAASIGGLSVFSKNSVDYGTSGGLYVEPNNLLSPTVMEGGEELSLHALLSFGRQITLGMEFLSQHNIVYGDLAARNILVCKDFRAKISDFGLSNDLYKDISCVGSGCKVPLRWMAIEAMIEKQFTTQSDVWSFGVVLWEIFSLGASPYSGRKNAEVIEFIANGYRLEKPPNCPEFLYLMMLQCWNEEPSERPSFGSMREHLDNIIATTEEAEEYMLLVGDRNQ